MEKKKQIYYCNYYYFFNTLYKVGFQVDRPATLKNYFA
jgi:hypothetical protein